MNIQLKSLPKTIRESATPGHQSTGSSETLPWRGYLSSGFWTIPPSPFIQRSPQHWQKILIEKSISAPRDLRSYVIKIAGYHEKRGYSFKADQVFIGPGSKELIYDFLFFIGRPCFYSLTQLGELCPPSPVFCKNPSTLYPPRRENDYKITP